MPERLSTRHIQRSVLIASALMLLSACQTAQTGSQSASGTNSGRFVFERPDGRRVGYNCTPGESHGATLSRARAAHAKTEELLLDMDRRFKQRAGRPPMSELTKEAVAIRTAVEARYGCTLTGPAPLEKPTPAG